MFPNTCENDNVQLKKKRDWSVNGKFGVGTSMGQIILPLLRQHGGVHKNGKSHKSHKSHKNGKDRKNGKDGENGKHKYSVYELSFYMMNFFKSERTISYFLRDTCTVVVRMFLSRSFRLQAMAIAL